MKIFIEKHKLGSKIWYYVSEGANTRPLSIPLKTREEAEEFIKTIFDDINFTYIDDKNNLLNFKKNSPIRKNEEGD